MFKSLLQKNSLELSNVTKELINLAAQRDEARGIIKKLMELDMLDKFPSAKQNLQLIIDQWDAE